jgi:hypothetical protein
VDSKKSYSRPLEKANVEYCNSKLLLSMPGESQFEGNGLAGGDPKHARCGGDQSMR